MIDYFALLQQPRKPWLEPEALKQKYQELTLAKHPDRQGSTPPDQREADSFPYRFAEITEGYRVLSDHKLRLQHLLSLEGHAAKPLPPEELIDVFMKIGSTIQEVDRLLEKLKNSTSALSKSLLRPEVLDSGNQLKSLLGELEDLRGKAVQQLRVVDQTWAKGQPEHLAELAGLANRFAYLDRWIEQLRERQFQLAN